MEIGEIVRLNIVRLLKDSDLSQKAIAKSVGVSEPTIYRWKSGENVPELDKLDRLAEILKIEASEFFKSQIDVKPALTMGKLAKRIANVPESVWEFIEKVSVDDKTAWEDVEAVLESAIEKREAKKTNKKA